MSWEETMLRGTKRGEPGAVAVVRSDGFRVTAFDAEGEGWEEEGDDLTKCVTDACCMAGTPEPKLPRTIALDSLRLASIEARWRDIAELEPGDFNEVERGVAGEALELLAHFRALTADVAVPAPTPPTRWAEVEIVGFRRHVGRVSEEVFADKKLLRVAALQPCGRFDLYAYGGAAIFSIHDVTEAEARRLVVPKESRACQAFSPSGALPSACVHCGHDGPDHDREAAEQEREEQDDDESEDCGSVGP